MPHRDGEFITCINQYGSGINYTDNRIVDRVIKIFIMAIFHVSKKLSEMWTMLGRNKQEFLKANIVLLQKKKIPTTSCKFQRIWDIEEEKTNKLDDRNIHHNLK